MENWYRKLLAFRKRGLADGWLDFKYKQTDHDLSKQIFQLVYEAHERRVVICSRLAEPEAPPVTVTLSGAAELILDSRNTEAVSSQPGLELQPRHCCIWLQPS